MFSSNCGLNLVKGNGVTFLRDALLSSPCIPLKYWSPFSTGVPAWDTSQHAIYPCSQQSPQKTPDSLVTPSSAKSWYPGPLEWSLCLLALVKTCVFHEGTPSSQPSQVAAVYSTALIQLDLWMGADFLFAPHGCFQIIFFPTSLKLNYMPSYPLFLLIAFSTKMFSTNSWDTPKPSFSLISIPSSPSLSLTLCPLLVKMKPSIVGLPLIFTSSKIYSPHYLRYLHQSQKTLSLLSCSVFSLPFAYLPATTVITIYQTMQFIIYYACF